MKLLNQEEAQRLCDRLVSLSKADECTVNLTGSRTGNIRFARNSVSTAGLVEDTQLVVSVAYGNKQGVAKIVRVIPDPKKDIGLNILSVFHYPRRIQIITCETRKEALKLLA